MSRKHTCWKTRKNQEGPKNKVETEDRREMAEHGFWAYELFMWVGYFNPPISCLWAMSGWRYWDEERKWIWCAYFYSGDCYCTLKRSHTHSPKPNLTSPPGNEKKYISDVHQCNLTSEKNNSVLLSVGLLQHIETGPLGALYKICQ